MCGMGGNLLTTGVCLCAEVSQAERCAGAWPGRMVLPQNTAGFRMVLVPCFRMQGPESHCCSLASPLLTQVCPWAVRGRRCTAIWMVGSRPGLGANSQLWHCSGARKSVELPLGESKKPKLYPILCGTAVQALWCCVSHPMAIRPGRTCPTPPSGGGRGVGGWGGLWAGNSPLGCSCPFLQESLEEQLYSPGRTTAWPGS